MAEVSDPERGLFPRPKQIHLSCTCPDWAVMCKHVAAILYGVGARLDEQTLLFVLRGVDHEELIDVDAGVAVPAAAPAEGGRLIAEEYLGEVFGIKLSPRPARARARTPDGPLSGKEVARLRRRFGMTQAQLALLLDVSGATVSNRERSPGPLRVLERVRAVWAGPGGPDPGGSAALSPGARRGSRRRTVPEVRSASPPGRRSGPE